MRTKTWTALAVVLAMAVSGAPAPAQPKSDAPAASPRAAAPEKIRGTVTDIDAQTGMVTLRTDSGQMHQFRGTRETLRDLKVGERIELTRRDPQRR